jgi:penicillin amidase
MRASAIVLSLAALIAGRAFAEVPGSARLETRAVVGLSQPGEILVDQWGVPHIYARTVRDAFFLQGYNAARDRLWQIDLWRKRGLGLLAKDFGPTYVEQDRAARLFLYRGDMTAEWAAYGPDAKARAEAFTAGVNAFVDEVTSGARPLPTEFTVAGSKPERWLPEDVVRIRSHALVGNVSNEVARANTVCKAGLAVDAVRIRLQPTWKTKVPAGLDPCSIPAEVLDDYKLGTKPVTFEAGVVKTAEATPEVMDGSNAWTIAPSRTATGRPILASDPHRALEVPSLRYIAHLNAPGLSVIGAGEPAMPGIAIGHNDDIAFGLTIFPTDQQDLYVYQTDPKNPDRYRYRGGWEAMTVVKETIAVKGEADRVVELRFTRHGPVLRRDPAAGRAFALRSIWMEAGASAYFGSARYQTVKDWAGFKAETDHWRAPPVNLVFADTAGDIGWRAAAGAPVRKNWDGLLPVPGDGRYEWDGLLPGDQLPSVENPSDGFFATANEFNLPKGYPYATRKTGFEWSDDSRVRRIKQVLGAMHKGRLNDSMALQADDHSSLGDRLKALLAPLSSDDATTREALALLKAWDGRVSRDSAAAPVFESWSYGLLGKGALAYMAPKAPAGSIDTAGLDAVMVWLEDPKTPKAARDGLMLTTLKQAMLDTQGRLGPDTKTWSWGRLHQITFRHALSPRADAALQAQMQAGPLEIGGGMTTPRLGAYKPDFSVFHGASFKMVLDVGQWDNSMAINSPGQSGDPFSPHYRDLFPLWAEGSYVPLLYSRAAVENATSVAIELTPR